MPRRITREEALARIAAEARERACLACALVEATRAEGLPLRPRVLERGAHATTILNAYPLAWGHALVVTHDHLTAHADLSADVASEVMRLVTRAATRIERTLRPARVFTASLGTSRDDLAMSTPHLHWHVLPVESPGARPRDVLTWEGGVLEASVEEWDELVALLVTPTPPG